MIQIGITGGIASGKSSVRKMFEKRGCVVFDADEEAKSIMTHDSVVKKSITEALGSRAFLSDGELNKAHIANLIFSNAEVRNRLNAIVHPAVMVRYQEAVLVAEQSGAPAIVREAAILASGKLRDSLDIVIAVQSGRGERIQRLLKRGTLTEEEGQARMRAQSSAAEFAAAADIIVTNDGTLGELEGKVDSIWKNLMDAKASGESMSPGTKIS